MAAGAPGYQLPATAAFRTGPITGSASRMDHREGERGVHLRARAGVAVTETRRRRLIKGGPGEGGAGAGGRGRGGEGRGPGGGGRRRGPYLRLGPSPWRPRVGRRSRAEG